MITPNYHSRPMEFTLQNQSSSPKEKSILSVSEISSHIKKNLESLFPSLQIQGEVSNFRRQASGHLYFSLKDEHAQISCVMFKGYTQQLKSLPKDGDQVTIRGSLSVYLPRGNYQVIVQQLQLAGLGGKLAQLEELKKKLHAKGYFSSQFKKSIPPFPKRIGIVTSPTGAAIQDMLNILNRRAAGFHLILNPVNVQGDLAAGEIAKAIKQFNELGNVDVLIVGRGGGSIEDLWAFNEEIVANAIFNSRIPIISAVGHEIDHTLADYVADLRAPTPSAAAELVMKDKESVLERLASLRKQVVHHIVNRLRSHKQELHFFKQQPYFSQLDWLLAPYSQKSDDFKQQLVQRWQQFIKEKLLLLEGKQKRLHSLKPSEKIRFRRQKLLDWHRQISLANQRKLYESKQNLTRLSRAMIQLSQQKLSSQRKQWELKNFSSSISLLLVKQLERKREKLTQLSNHLTDLNPQTILNKGYHIIFSEKTKQAIISTKQLSAGDSICIQSKDGHSIAEIKESNINE